MDKSGIRGILFVLGILGLIILILFFDNEMDWGWLRFLIKIIKGFLLLK